jgi:hypothetical protein
MQSTEPRCFVYCATFFLGHISIDFELRFQSFTLSILVLCRILVRFKNARKCITSYLPVSFLYLAHLSAPWYFVFTCVEQNEFLYKSCGFPDCEKTDKNYMLSTEPRCYVYCATFFLGYISIDFELRFQPFNLSILVLGRTLIRFKSAKKWITSHIPLSFLYFTHLSAPWF